VNTLKSTNLKELSISIALILLLIISSAVTILPTANAATLPDAPTYPGLTVAPSPVGVGQPVQVIMFISYLPASEGYEWQQFTGQPYEIPHGGWKGYMLTITKPDGTTESMGPYESDPSGLKQIAYTPTTTGTYYFQFTFPGQVVANTSWGGFGGLGYYYNANFLASTSKKIELTVQEDPISYWHWAPIPTEDWSRPITGENREWFTIGGPWLMSSYNATGRFNPYTTVVNAAHILWAKSNNPLGGLIGGDYGSLEFQRSTGFSVAAIMGGKVYYSGPVSSTGTNQFYCMDIKTGQQMWSQPAAIAPSMASILNWRSLQSKIEIPYLWSLGGTYNMYDAQTGRLLLSFSGASTGTAYLEPAHPTALPGTTDGGACGGGALLVFVTGSYYNAANRAASRDWIACWNSTKAMQSISNDVHAVSYTTGSTIPWSNGLMWNISYPYTDAGPLQGVGGNNPPLAAYGAYGNYNFMVRLVSEDTLIVGKCQTYYNDTNQALKPYVGINTKTGAIKWTNNVSTVPYTAESFTFQGGCLSYGKWTSWESDTQTLYCYSEATGAQVWKAQPAKSDFAMQSGVSVTAAYGKFFVSGYDGYIHCINADTGAVEWSSMSRLGGTEMPEETYPFSAITVADGKIFSSTTKSYETEPLYRGHCLYALNATTGEQVWNISGQMTTQYVSDGYLLAANNYDNQIYCFAKGPTATTVTAPMTSVTAGYQVVIQGTVTDQSPGAKGSPAIADKDMTAWMQYKYMDQPMPTNAKGVAVSIDAVDPNNNFVHLGDTTSDNTGNYGFAWTPPNIPGKYTIIASFAGSESYFSSLAETTAIVVEAPGATPAATSIPQSVADMYFVPGVAAIIIAIAIVGVVIVLILRKRP
jgi:outer membrane protein assembly factor BamB